MPRHIFLVAIARALAPLFAAVDAEDLLAADYLSEDYFPGLHVLEPRGDIVRIFRDGQRTDSPIEVKADWESMQDARKALERALQLPPLEPFQPPWGLFGAQGERLQEVRELLERKVAFITIIGQWMWPAVRVGFEQVGKGILEGAPLTLKTLSIRPVVFQVDGFILPKETDFIIDMGKKKNMFNSEGVLVTADKQSKRAHNTYRTSTQTWLHRHESTVINELDLRTSNLTRIPTDHNEDVQLLRYGEGQFYFSHLDWSHLPLYNGQRGQWLTKFYGWRDRMATLFWYLNDVESGGETVFPKHGQPICPGVQSHCPGAFMPPTHKCDVGLQVKPKRGSVILWYNFHADGRGDQNTQHGGCPPAPGHVKWSGNKWIHSQSLRLRQPEWMPDHPALKRFGWQEMNDEPAKVDPNACSLQVRSQLAEAGKLLWVNPSSNEEQEVSEIPPGESVSMKSYKGHKFIVANGDKKTKAFPCHMGNGKTSSYTVTKDMKLRRKKDEL